MRKSVVLSGSLFEYFRTFLANVETSQPRNYNINDKEHECPEQQYKQHEQFEAPQAHLISIEPHDVMKTTTTGQARTLPN